MDSTYKFDANIQGLLRCNATIACGGFTDMRVVLLDSGAGICHMTYNLWCTLGLKKHLTISYIPTKTQSICRLTLDPGGEELMRHDRMLGISNNLADRFVYMHL